MADLNAAQNDFYAFRPATVECVVQAAKKVRVPANVLLALATVEGGKNGQTVRNTNGTYDISHFQINTSTYKSELQPHGVKLADLQWRGCYNAEIAGYLLSRHLNDKRSQNKDFWTRAANYHSKTPRFNAIYREKLINASTGWANWLSHKYSDVKITYK
ncbi:hypothetical protein RCH14_004531 [Massilia sp. MP_M2]|uniref:lytic transglycosylase, catalytic n=1 Tax=Massilia sp. MP_M2 TaxID=3071713 RepID=UPI00319DCA18